MQIPSKSQSAFIQVAVAGSSYVADLGYYAESGWKELAVSEVVQTPREAFSAERAARFATFPIDIPLERAQVTAKPAATPEPVPPTLYREPVAPHAASIPPQPSDLSRAITILQAAPGFLSNFVDFSPPVLPVEMVAPPAPVVPGLPAQEGDVWTPAQEAALADLIGWKPKQQPPGSD